jgi:hypothetical protein
MVKPRKFSTCCDCSCWRLAAVLPASLTVVMFGSSAFDWATRLLPSGRRFDVRLACCWCYAFLAVMLSF